MSIPYLSDMPAAIASTDAGEPLVIKVDALIAAMPTLVSEANAMATWAETRASNAAGFESSAAGFAAAALADEGLAAGFEGDALASKNTAETAVSLIITESNPFDISLASYSSKFFYAGTQEITPTGLTFSANGLAMYVVGVINDSVYQYVLTAAWDVSTASYASKSFSVAAQETTPNAVRFSIDGLSMYVVGPALDNVFQYTLATEWDVSTASYSGKSLSVAAQGSSPRSVTFNAAGTALYVVGDSSDTVWQYTLGTAWDVSTASYASKSFSVAAQESQPHSVDFNADGTLMFILGSTSDSVWQYTLGTAWDVSTASYSGKSLSVAAQDSAPTELAFNTDRTAMYVVGLTTDTVYQYTLPQGPGFPDLTNNHGKTMHINPTSDGVLWAGAKAIGDTVVSTNALEHTPPEWLECDGSSFSSAAYPELYAVLGTTTLPSIDLGGYPWTKVYIQSSF